MRGVNRLKNWAHKTKLYLGESRLLTNWQELRDQAQRAKNGELLNAAPVLRFKSGLRINMVPASHADWHFLFEEIFVDRCYQPTEDFAPRTGWTVIDLGANMGFFTCQVASAAPSVRVVSVEPLRPYQEALKQNVKDNQFSGVTVVEGAICGEPDQKIQLTVWYTHAGELKTGAIPADAARVEHLTAKGYTLPQVFEIGKVQQCDLLKVDIEGAEYELFEKIPPEYWARISRVVMEVHRDDTRSEKQIMQILERNNFTTYLKNEDSITPLLWALKNTAKA